MKRHVFLTGNPGCGKTTVVVRLADLLRKTGVGVAGFYTEEMREQGARVGFGIRTLAGAEGILSHVKIRSPHRVGRYGVDVAGFERLVLPALSPDQDVRAFLIDEIGKMETFSTRFVEAVERLLHGERPVVATISLRGGGAIARLRNRADAEVAMVSPANRGALPADLLRRLTEGGLKTRS